MRKTIFLIALTFFYTYAYCRVSDDAIVGALKDISYLDKRMTNIESQQWYIFTILIGALVASILSLMAQKKKGGDQGHEGQNKHTP